MRKNLLLEKLEDRKRACANEDPDVLRLKLVANTKKIARLEGQSQPSIDIFLKLRHAQTVEELKLDNMAIEAVLKQQNPKTKEQSNFTPRH